MNLIPHIPCMFFCFAVFAGQTQPLSSPFIIKRFTSYDGLPHNYVLNIQQDKHGYLWVGTAYGLCKFDGVHFSPVEINTNKTSLIITGGVETDNGNIWITTRDDGRFIYDGKKLMNVPDSFYISKGLTGFDSTIVYDWMQPQKYLIRARTPDGWFLNLKNEIIFINKSGDTTLLPPDGGYFKRIIGYENDQLYYFSDKGLHSWSQGNVKTLFEKQLADKPLYSCYRDSKKRFWIGTRNDGIYVSKPGEKIVLDFHIQLAHNLISGFYEDNEGNMWIGGIEGLIKVTDMLYEKYDRGQYPFLWDINMVSKKNNDELLIFSETFGLIRRTKDRFIYTGNTVFKNQLVDALCYDSDGRTWCVTRQGRLLLYNGSSSSDLTSLMKSNSGDDLYLDISYDRLRNKIWINSDTLSIGDENGFRIFQSSGKQYILYPKRIKALREGTLLVATTTNHFYIVNSKNEINEINTSGLFDSKNLLNFYCKDDGDIFISVIGEGLLQCRLTDNTLVVKKRYNTGNSLKNNFVLSVEMDKQKRMWVATMGGITVIDIEKEVYADAPPVYHLGVKDSLPEFGIGYDRLACDEEGNMWYTTLYTVSKFYTDKIVFADRPPPVTIEKVKINLEETNWANYRDSVSPVYKLPDHPILKYSENTISFYFNAASMNWNGDYQYSYFLTGVTDLWSNGSSNSSLTFSKLKPGTYTFFVRARANNMNWSIPTRFSFTILKPYWQTWWFKTLIALAAAGIIYGIYLYRLRQIIKMQMIRNNIARDLHDDLGSTLNSVKIYADVAAIEKDNDKYLGKIKESTREAITSVRDIIWVLDEKKDSLEHLFTRISQFAEPVCAANHINFHHSIGENIYTLELHREEKRNLYLIIKEVINNSIKYASCQNISVQASGGKRNLTLQITDDGIGFDEQQVAKGNGLNNIRTRANEIDYQLEILSNPQMGTSVILEKN